MDKLNVKNKLGLFFARQKQYASVQIEITRIFLTRFREEKGSVKPEDWIPALDERIITACCNRLSEGRFPINEFSENSVDSFCRS